MAPEGQAGEECLAGGELSTDTGRLLRCRQQFKHFCGCRSMKSSCVCLEMFCCLVQGIQRNTWTGVVGGGETGVVGVGEAGVVGGGDAGVIGG